MLTVVKVGGGPARAVGAPAFRALCAAIGAAGAEHQLLVVPGGGAFADAVREHDRRFGLAPASAHRMAILAMEQFGWALGDLIPGAVRCTALSTAARAARGRRTPVLLPAAVLAREDPLPASWDVTSDSIAAWVAGRVRARRLVLVKASGGRDVVDAHFPAALAAAGVEAWVVDAAQPQRLAELLAGGRTAGTRISPGAG